MLWYRQICMCFEGQEVQEESGTQLDVPVRHATDEEKLASTGMGQKDPDCSSLKNNDGENLHTCKHTLHYITANISVNGNKPWGHALFLTVWSCLRSLSVFSTYGHKNCSSLL